MTSSCSRRTLAMRLAFLGAILACLTLPAPAVAWGNEGHETIALIARGYLTADVRATVDAILASDTDTLTAPDLVSRATWADAWRGAGHRETASWHFVDIELGAPDLRTACFGFPAAATPASAGPVQDCVVDKVREFTAELASPATSQLERVLALKYLLHFVGDLHQPLHAANNQDRGGNCVLIALGARTVNLHAWWDTVVVGELGSDPVSLATLLTVAITPAQIAQWQAGDAGTWAQETFAVARAAAYRVGSPAGCTAGAAPLPLPPGYDDAARAAATLQLERAGVRLAMVLNHSLSGISVAESHSPARQTATPPSTAGVQGSTMRSAVSLACSAEANRLGLHGSSRKLFRRRCIREHQQAV